MRHILNYLVVDMLSELYGSFSAAGGAYSPAFAREGDKERVLATIAEDPSSAVSENSAIQVLIKGFSDFIPKDSILMLELDLYPLCRSREKQVGSLHD